MKLKVMALVLMLGIVGRVESEITQFHTGNEMLEICESEAPYEITSCYLYLAGLVDTTEVWKSWVKLPESGVFCVPQQSVTQSQLRKIYIHYANEHPKMLHLSASYVGVYAFFDAFPCK